jgi:hypothetical protein
MRRDPARRRDRGHKGKGGRLGSPCLHKRISSVGKVRPSDPRGSRGDSTGRRSRLTLARARAETLAMEEHSSAFPWRKAWRSPMSFRPQAAFRDQQSRCIAAAKADSQILPSTCPAQDLIKKQAGGRHGTLR